MDWLEMADLMDARTHLTQDYSFSRYSPLAAAGVHYLCRSDQRVAVSQPKKVQYCNDDGGVFSLSFSFFLHTYR